MPSPRAAVPSGSRRACASCGRSGRTPGLRTRTYGAARWALPAALPGGGGCSALTCQAPASCQQAEQAGQGEREQVTSGIPMLPNMDPVALAEALGVHETGEPAGGRGGSQAG